MKLTKEERAILNSVERGEWRSVPDVKDENARYEAVAAAFQWNDERDDVPIEKRDFCENQSCLKKARPTKPQC